MAEIEKKKSDGRELAEWNPLRAFRDLLRWDPFREMAPLFQYGGQYGRQAGPAFERMELNPRFDVTENKDSFVFKADVPGVKKEDLEISTTGNRIQISGKREAETETKSETVYTYEREYGNFVRSFTLPDGADLEHAKSELKDGVLTLVIPKLPGAQAKKIPISAGGAKS
ncbi:MAG TPA: Hsp20/alpha crystallin family protein [Kofleriaceae bacterium]|nr:Hsp20/alpha crystallin family protein [Kofleriaceae bacterium]